MFAASPRRLDPIMCRAQGVENAGDERTYRGEWWEYQANRVMAALLLPRQLFREQALAEMGRVGIDDVSAIATTQEGHQVIQALRDIFDVNAPMVAYRFQQLGLTNRNPDQTSLAFDSN